MIAMTSPIFFNDRKRLMQLTLRRGPPAMFFQREFVELGAIPSVVALFEHAADYGDRIAKGAKPTDLPVEQPTKFELILNLKTARIWPRRADLAPFARRRRDRIGAPAAKLVRSSR